MAISVETSSLPDHPSPVHDDSNDGNMVPWRDTLSGCRPPRMKKSRDTSFEVVVAGGDYTRMLVNQELCVSLYIYHSLKMMNLKIYSALLSLFHLSISSPPLVLKPVDSHPFDCRPRSRNPCVDQATTV